MAGLDEVRSQLARARAAASGLIPAVAVLVAVACGAEPSRQADQAALPPGYVVDSIHPPEEARRRFRAGLPEVDTLAGMPSRDDLVGRFMRALVARDSATLMSLTVSRAEFAYLVYPESRLAKPPYRQPPEIAWLNLSLANEAGLRKLLARAAGMRPLGYACPDSATPEGKLRITSGCTVRVREAGSTRDVRLFGRVVELDGRWKLIALDGDL